MKFLAGVYSLGSWKVLHFLGSLRASFRKNSRLKINQLEKLKKRYFMDRGKIKPVVRFSVGFKKTHFNDFITPLKLLQMVQTFE